MKPRRARKPGMKAPSRKPRDPSRMYFSAEESFPELSGKQIEEKALAALSKGGGCTFADLAKVVGGNNAARLHRVLNALAEQKRIVCSLEDRMIIHRAPQLTLV